MAEIPVAVEAELTRLRAENARLPKLLGLTPQQAASPAPGQVAIFEAPPGVVHHRSPQEAKVAFFGALFAARTDVYAIRYDNQRTGKSGWVPAVRGGWQKGTRHEDRNYLPLTRAVLASHLKGEVHVGLYPLLDGDKCWWLAADFDGPEAMFDALMYVKAARALQVPVALEVSRSGVGAHAWVFFTSPVPAEMARRLGTGLLREAMALRSRMSLASYDRLFPSQDLLPAGGVGNLIPAPLFRPARDNGATVFMNLETLERHEDQWAYLSTLGRMTPQELKRAAERAGKVAVATDVTRLTVPSSTVTKPPAPPVLRVRLGAGIRLEQAELTPGLAATLRHAASMHNPEFYERQRMRASTYGIPRFLHCYQETIDGGLVLPRGMLDTGHLETIASALRALGHEPVILKGGTGARARAAALARLAPQPGGPPLLAVATGPYAGEGFDCPPLDTLFLAAPVASKGRLLQYAGRILRPYDGKATAEVHDCHDEHTGVLASSLAKRAPGYTSLGFPDPRKLPYTPSSTTARPARSGEPAA